MCKSIKYIVLLTVFVLFSKTIFSQQYELSLNSNWSIQCNDTGKFINATVPGSIYTDLLRNKIIPDPFIGENEQKVQWVANQTWTYKNSFNIEKSELERFTNAEIVFSGVDTYAKVYLNDSLIIDANNMFIPYNSECKRFLKIGKNEIKVIFPPIIPILNNEKAKLKYELPEKERVFARKAQFHFGWDWAPRILNIGIFKPVKLVFWNNIIIDQITTVTNIKNDIGDVFCSIPIRKYDRKKAEFELIINDTKTKRNFLKKSILIFSDTIINCNFKINNPKIWNPNGEGVPNLYNIEITIKNSKKGIQKFNKTIGFRDIKLIQKPDSIGSSFYFEVNGKPVFAKGTNWVPNEFFQHKLTKEKYKKQLILAQKAGYNMIRVWGGGWYEEDSFYDLCDSLGIMVWQDFMFACAMYPFDSVFQKNIAKEFDYQTRRLSSHPSIALWCGNNENYEGWSNWGWQKQFNYSANDSLSIWNSNKSLFETLIPNQLQKTYFSFPYNYHPSSPANGWGRDTAYKTADVHYWGVWWGMEPFEIYNKKVGRFVSEYGFQGYPSLETLQYAANEKIDSLNQPSIAAHQKHPRGFQTINKYLQCDYPKPKTVEETIYLSQLMQADGIKIAILAHRGKIPFCMGTLFWQFNDCWSSISWSAIDYFNRPKQFYYITKQLFKPIIPIIKIDTNCANIFINNIDNKAFKGKINIIGMNYKGDTIFKNSIISSSEVLSSKLISTVANSNFKNSDLFYAEIVDEKGLSISEEIVFKEQPKNMKLLTPKISIDIDNSNFSNKIYIKSDVPIKGLWLNCDGFTFDKNGFDMMPNKIYSITYSSENKQINKQIDLKNIETYSLNQSINFNK